MKFDTGDFHEGLPRNARFWLKSDRNVGHFAERRKYVYIVDSRTEYFVARQQWEGNPFLLFHGNNEHFILFTATCGSTIQRERNYNRNVEYPRLWELDGPQPT
jgi:hypothetical protein